MAAQHERGLSHLQARMVFTQATAREILPRLLSANLPLAPSPSAEEERRMLLGFLDCLLGLQVLSTIKGTILGLDGGGDRINAS
jgi:hypothetical protein